MRAHYLALRRTLLTGFRWGLYGLVAAITLAEMAHVILGEWFDEPPDSPPENSPGRPLSERISS